jgi:filamentous hemagglutinin
LRPGNPAGIYANGSGFINASRATLTTGTPQLNAGGGLDSFIVRGGTVRRYAQSMDCSPARASSPARGRPPASE